MAELFVSYYGVLCADCLIIAIETIGLVKFVDNFVFPERDLILREKCGLEFCICILCALCNSSFVDAGIKDVSNLFLLSLSLTQLAYDCIVHGIPKFLEKLFNRKE